MAVIAPITSPHMYLMAEFHRFHVLLRWEIVINRLQHWVTLLAVFLDTECFGPVMTEPAGKTLFHVSHGKTLVAFLGNKHLVVTIVTSV